MILDVAHPVGDNGRLAACKIPSKIRSFLPEVDNATADPAHLQRLAENLCSSEGKLRWMIDVADPIGQILGQPKGFLSA